MKSRFLAALLAPAAAAVPASAQDGPAAAPDTLPPVSFYLDSAAAVAALRALPPAELPEGIPPLFALVFDSTGAVARAAGVFDQLPAAFTGPVSSILRAHARPQQPSRRPPGTYLRIATGPAAAIEKPVVIRRRMSAANENDVAQLLQSTVVRRAAAVGEGVGVRVRLKVRADGSADSVSLATSTGDAVLDRATVAAAHQLRFHPETVEGIPVSAWAVVPFRLLVEGGPGDEPEYRIQRVHPVSRRAPLATLVDSAALVRALAALPADAPDGALFGVWYDTAGAVAKVEPVRAPASLAAALGDALRAHLRPRPPSPEPLHLNLRLVPGPGARVDRPVAGQLAPSLANHDEVVRLLRRAARLHGGGRIDADLLLAVGEDGTPDPASVGFAGAAPDAELAGALAAIAARMRFRPSAIGGAPARTWIRMPLRIGRRPRR